MQDGIVMDSVNSIHFLWYAYVLVGRCADWVCGLAGNVVVAFE